MSEIVNSLHSTCLRAMGGVDLNPLSRTYGCADRGYWHYQDGKGFPVGSMQVSALGFWSAAQLVDPSFSQAYRATIDWWMRVIEDGDGSFDEYFSSQKSFCATAYCAMGIGLVLRLEKAGEFTSQHLAALAKSVNYLTHDKHRPESANQTLAAMLAFDLSGIAGENPFAPILIADGNYYSEYGGFDLGYSLKCIDICALGVSVLKTEKLIEKYSAMAKLLLERLHFVTVSHCFHPSLGSRGNAHRLLGGLHYFSRNGHPFAGAIIQALTRTDRFLDLVSAEKCDDKYLSFFHLTSLSLWADEKGMIFKPVKWILPTETPTLQPLKLEQGLCWYRTSQYQAVVTAQRSLLHIEAGGKQVTFAGQLAKKNGDTWVSSSFPRSQFSVTTKGDEILVKHPLHFNKLKSRTPMIQSWWFSLLLRTGIKLPVVGQALRNYIYRKSVHPSSGEAWGEREIHFKQDHILVRDKFNVSLDEIRYHSGWIMTDGHATRMHGRAKMVFGPGDTVAAGKALEFYPLKGTP